MPISIHCPGCGKTFQVRDQLAGKQARCRCGAPIRIPVSASADPAWADEVAKALGETPGTTILEPVIEATPRERPEPLDDDDDEEAEYGVAESPKSVATPVRPADNLPAPGQDLIGRTPKPPRSAVAELRGIFSNIPPRAKWKPKKGDPWPGIVAIASAVYGVVAVLALVAYTMILSYVVNGLSLSMFSLIFRMGIAVMISAGGILMAKGDPRGPAWVGLACLLFCCFPAWGFLWSIAALLAGAPLLDFLLTLGFSIVSYGVPVAITIWALRKEMERERKKEEE